MELERAAQPTDRDTFNLQEAFEMARETIRTLFALNGAAAIAILAFYGQALTASNAISAAARTALSASLSWFTVGATWAALTFVVAYCTQLFWGSSYDSENTQAVAHRFAQRAHLFAAVFAIFSLGSFMLGVVDVREAIESPIISASSLPGATKAAHPQVGKQASPPEATAPKRNPAG